MQVHSDNILSGQGKGLAQAPHPIDLRTGQG